MHHVLRPGGQALLIDLRSDASAEAIDAHVKGMGRIKTCAIREAQIGLEVSLTK